jgi:U32 family peptidase
MNDEALALKHSKDILKNDFARKKTKYFFNENKLDYLNPKQEGEIGIALGNIINVENINQHRMGLLNTKTELSINDTVRFHSAEDKFRKSEKIKNISKKAEGFYIPIPEEVKIDDSVFLIERNQFRTRYNAVIPRSLKRYTKRPELTHSPGIKQHGRDKNIIKHFQSGIYVKVSNFKDLYVTQSSKPEKIILDFSRENINNFKSNFKALSYKNDDIIFYLDPYFPFKDEEWLAEEINYFTNIDFKYFVVNNIGHLNLFKNKKAILINGPYLYTFNKYSLEFINLWSCDFFISPLENSKDNLLETTEKFNRDTFFITLFSYPELFYITADFSKKYNFNVLSNQKHDLFNLTYYKNKTVVIPDKPFAILNRIPELKKIGFNKFIIDFSNINLKKNFYKQIMQTANVRSNMDSSSRFNWKDGFYKVQQ